MADGTRAPEFKKLEERIIQKLKEIILECAKSTEDRLATEIADLKALIMQSYADLTPKEDGGSRYQIVISFPNFDGTDLEGWLFKCETYFKIVHTPVSIKVILASFHLSYDKRRGDLGMPPWEDYVSDLKARFGAIGDQVYENPMAELKRLYQDGDLSEYIEAFDACIHRTNLSEENIVSCFIAGLKDEVRYSVLMQGPKTLQQAYALSRMQDACLTSLRTGKSTGIKSQFGVPGQISGNFSKQTPYTPQGLARAQATWIQEYLDEEETLAGRAD